MVSTCACCHGDLAFIVFVFWPCSLSLATFSGYFLFPRTSSVTRVSIGGVTFLFHRSVWVISDGLRGLFNTSVMFANLLVCFNGFQLTIGKVELQLDKVKGSLSWHWYSGAESLHDLLVGCWKISSFTDWVEEECTESASSTVYDGVLVGVGIPVLRVSSPVIDFGFKSVSWVLRVLGGGGISDNCSSYLSSVFWSINFSFLKTFCFIYANAGNRLVRFSKDSIVCVQMYTVIHRMIIIVW